MNSKSIHRIYLLKVAFFLCMIAVFQVEDCKAWQKEQSTFKKITFPSADGTLVTADLYRISEDKKTPMIVLCHQAGWSRGEYREIAPKLNQMGYNCLAIDQRSGNAVNNVKNETMSRAKKAGKKTGFLDAQQDIESALKFARKNYTEGELVLWGSSYSAALSLVVAGKNPKLCDRVLSFAPGEYFTRFGKTRDWVQKNSSNIKVPVFITSAKHEYKNWKKVFEGIKAEKKVKFVPKTKGNHGSRALWKRFDDAPEYWKAVKMFLKN